MTVRYFIDSENVGDFWISLLDLPAEQTELIVFYTRNSPHMSYDSLIRLKESDRKVTFIKCYEGTNALDFQLVTELGYQISQNEGDSFVIVTNDTGFDAAVKYWKRNRKSVKRITGKECKNLERRRKEDLEQRNSPDRFRPSISSSAKSDARPDTDIETAASSVSAGSSESQDVRPSRPVLRDAETAAEPESDDFNDGPFDGAEEAEDSVYDPEFDPVDSDMEEEAGSSVAYDDMDDTGDGREYVRDEWNPEDELSVSENPETEDSEYEDSEYEDSEYKDSEYGDSEYGEREYEIPDSSVKDTADSTGIEDTDVLPEGNVFGAGSQLVEHAAVEDGAPLSDEEAESDEIPSDEDFAGSPDEMTAAKTVMTGETNESSAESGDSPVTDLAETSAGRKVLSPAHEETASISDLNPTAEVSELETEAAADVPDESGNAAGAEAEEAETGEPDGTREDSSSDSSKRSKSRRSRSRRSKSGSKKQEQAEDTEGTEEKKNSGKTRKTAAADESETAETDGSAPEVLPVPGDEEISRIVACIGADNLAELHNQLATFYGDQGKDIYLSIKNNTRSLPVLKPDLKQKFAYYCEIIFARSDYSGEYPSDISEYLLNVREKLNNLNSLRYALQKHYGKEKGRRFYFILKPFAKTMYQM